MNPHRLINLLVRILKDPGLTLATAWTFNQLAYAIVYPFIPLYLSNERGIPYSQVGLIFPLMGIMVMLAPMAAGPLTDRLGRRLVMDFGQFARGGLFLLLAVMTYFHAPFWLFAAVLMVNTAVGVTFQVGADAYLADITTEEERPSYYGKIRIGYNLGWALGPMIGAFFAKTPFWLFFAITALLCFAGGLYTHLRCRAQAIRRDSAARKQTGKHGSILPLLWQQKRLLFLLFGSVMLFSLTSQLYSTLSVYSTQRVGISREALGIIYSLNGFLVILLQMPITAILKYCRVRLVLQICGGTLLYIVGYFSLAFCRNAWMLAAAVTVLTFGEMVVLPALYAAFSNETVPENAGRILAAFSLFRGVGYAVGPWFGAQFFQYMSSPILLWGALAAFAVVALVFFALTWHPRFRRRPVDDAELRIQ